MVTEPWHQWFRGASLGAVLVAISGCGAHILQDAADYKVAVQANDIRKKIDLQSVMDAERSIQQQILDHELTVVTRFSEARRDYALLNLMTAKMTPTKNLKRLIEQRENELIGSEVPKLSNVSISYLVPAATDCGTGLVDPNGETAATWLLKAVAARDACAEELVDANAIFSGTLGFAAPHCIPGRPLEPFAELKPELQALMIKRFKKTNRQDRRTDTKIREVVKEAYKNFRDKCDTVSAVHIATAHMIVGCSGKQCGPRAAGQASIVGLTGELKRMHRRLTRRTSNLAAERAVAKAAEADYRQAKKSYANAAKEHAVEDAEVTRNKLAQAAKTLRESSETLQNAAGLFGRETMITDQIAEIDQIMQATATGEYDLTKLKVQCAAGDCELAKAMAVAAQLPSFIERISRITTLAEAPPLSVLELEKSRLFALKIHASSEVARREVELKLLNQSCEAIIAEVKLLQRGAKQLRLAREMTVEQFINPATDPARKELLLRAIAAYLRSFTGPRRTVHANEYKLVALLHAEALDHSQASIDIWKSALETSVAALLAYHEGGLKQEDILELIRVLGIGGIAVGVN